MAGQHESERETDDEMEALFGDPPGPYEEFLDELDGRLEALLHPIAFNTAAIAREVRRAGLVVVLLLAVIAVELWFGLGLSWEMLAR